MKKGAAPGKAARAAAVDEPEPELTLGEVRERLWRALPSVQRACEEAAGVTPTGANVAVEVDVAPAVPGTLVPHDEVRRVVENVYLATHGNPIARDVDDAVDAVLGTAEAPTQTVYTQEELYGLLDSLPPQWLPQLVLPDAPLQRAALVKKLNEELVDCILHDEPPYELLPKERVLMLSRTVPQPTRVESAVADFLTFTTHPPYAAVFDTLWRHLVADENAAATALTPGQFRVFFVWFHVLHVVNTTPTRSEAAAETHWVRALDVQGTMSMTAFQQACCEMCGIYAQRRDPATYLQLLVDATAAALRRRGASDSGLPFFHLTDDVVAEVTAAVGCVRRPLLDPVAELYVPTVLPPDVTDAALEAMQLVSRTRVVVHGRFGVNKRRVGRALAARLQAVYVDVHERALAALRRQDAIGRHLATLLATEQPIPLSLQAELLRDALTSPRARYHGYVLSDTLVPCGCAAQAAAMAAYVGAAGLCTHCVPTALVELSVTDEAVYDETHARAEMAAAARRQAAYRAMDELQTRRARRAERQARRARAEAALQSLVSAEAAVSAVPATIGPMSKAAAAIATAQLEERRRVATAALTAAQTAAAAAQSELRALDVEEMDAMESDEEGDAAEVERECEKEQLYYLLRQGRLASCTCAIPHHTAGTALGKALPCLRDVVDRAAVEQRVLAVGAWSAADDIARYVVAALELRAGTVARRVRAPDDASDVDDAVAVDDDDDDEVDAEDEEEAGRLNEQHALAQGLVASHVWKRFCPVTMLEDEVLVEGAACYACEYRGHVYYCASRAKRRRLMAQPSYYLAHEPRDYAPVLLLADDDTVVRRVTAELAPRLRLTPIALADYADAMTRRHQLQQQRDAVWAGRQAYEVDERAARAERLERRQKLAAKRRRAAQARKPKPRRSLGANAEQDAATTSARNSAGRVRPETVRARRVEDAVAEQIAAQQRRRRDAVAILVYGDATDVGQCGFLAQHGLLPETIVMLQRDDAESDGTDVTDVVATLEEERQVRVCRVTAARRALEHVLSEVLHAISPAAAPVVDDVVDENLGEDDDNDDEEDDDDEEREETKDTHARPELALRPGRRFLHQFGSRLNYCPVTLVEKGLLVRGQHEWCVRYRDELYVFASEACKRQFQRNPREYLARPIPRTLPPRLWIVGPQAAGRRTLAAALQKCYDVPSFVYDRDFFERCVAAAQKAGGAWVRPDLFIPEDVDRANPYVQRASALLAELRSFAAAQADGLARRAAAERALAAREDAAAARADDDDEDDDDATASSHSTDSGAEAQLRAQLDFEPEDEEERQVRLTEAYLCIASCVTRMEPFASRGYVMVCPPFSEGDLEVLFREGGVPEVVVRLHASAQTLQARTTSTPTSVTAVVDTAEDDARRVARWRRVRERRLRRWRRRHIGADDPVSDDEDDNDKDDVPRRVSSTGQERDAAAAEVDRAAEADALEAFTACVTENLIDVVELHGDGGRDTVLHQAQERLGRHLPQRGSLFFVPRVVTYATATRLLRRGRVRYSCFGDVDVVWLHARRAGARRRCHWMPPGRTETEETVRDVDVNVVDNTAADDDNDDAAETEAAVSEYGSDELREMRAAWERRQRRRDARTAPRAAVLCGEVYFFHDDASLRLFVRDPMHYVEQPPPPPALRVQPLVAVFEQDAVRVAAACFSGVKSRGLAESLAHTLGYCLLSVPKLLSWGATQTRLGSLATQAVAAALHGVVEPTLLRRLLRLRLASAEVRGRGAVLLNVPRTVSDYEAVLNDAAMERTRHGVGATIVRVCADQSTVAADTGVVARALRAVWTRMQREAAMTLPLPCPRDITSAANLNETVRAVDRVVEHARQARRRCEEAVPVVLHDGYHAHAELAQGLSEYGWYCPYAWREKNELEWMYPDETTGPRWGALYLGKYYVFSSADYLDRFLRDPCAVADPTTLRPLPPALPTHVAAPSGVELETYAFAGCCPVLLYDTRDRRGLRGSVEPVAKRGSVDCVVRYENKYYALLDRAHLERFMRQPWTFVAAAVLPPPRKCPLSAAEAAAGLSHETFMRRQLYDAVAHAMLAVAAVRPHYPGLSVEESALKFMALHMKAHNEANNAVQQRQYQENLDLFVRRATLFRQVGQLCQSGSGGSGNADEDAARAAQCDALCAEYEHMIYGEDNVTDFIHLRDVVFSSSPVRSQPSE